jgi:hypothetical protein
MLSLILWTTLLLADLLLTAAASAWAARKVGSPRGRFSLGLLATFIILLVNVVLLAAVLPTGEGKEFREALQEQLVSLAVLSAVALLVFFKTFRLSFGRAFAPLGTSLAVNILFVVLLLVVIRPRISQSYLFPSGSMSPTLKSGDRFFVNKLTRPRRWDLVTFWVPQPTMRAGRMMLVRARRRASRRRAALQRRPTLRE